MSPRRAPSVVLPLLFAAAALGACSSHADRAARRADRADEEAVRDAAARAAALATGDTDAAGRTPRHDSQPHVGFGVDGSRGLVRGGDPPLGPGDVRVVSTDGAIVLALVGDTVRMRMGDSLTTQVQRKLDAGADSAAGFGGFIARTVKGAVGGAMAEAARFVMRVPVAEVQDLRYENGELKVNGNHHKGMQANARFTPADAERFMNAVRTRQRALGVPVAGG